MNGQDGVYTVSNDWTGRDVCRVLVGSFQSGVIQAEVG
jgi:hypothetical protein